MHPSRVVCEQLKDELLISFEYLSAREIARLGTQSLTFIVDCSVDICTSYKIDGTCLTETPTEFCETTGSQHI